jgi:hypothetical protein
MPQSRKRKGHPFQKPSDIPSGQRTKGRILWAILIGVFSLLIALFAVGLNYVMLSIVLIAGAFVGYVIGKSMEKQSRQK